MLNMSNREIEAPIDDVRKQIISSRDRVTDLRCQRLPRAFACAASPSFSSLLFWA
jgi:hypothetical protein